jgi:hypothetical protein
MPPPTPPPTQACNEKRAPLTQAEAVDKRLGRGAATRQTYVFNNDYVLPYMEVVQVGSLAL